VYIAPYTHIYTHICICVYAYVHIIGMEWRYSSMVEHLPSTMRPWVQSSVPQKNK
jgi:hypothetical protein